MNNPESVFPLLVSSLKRITSLKTEDINEADTRLQIVDDILQYLGWSKNEFSPEQPTGIGNYTDYIFKVNGAAHLVVEAKRLGKTFILPQQINKKEYKASYLINACGIELKEAMMQASQYCNEKGAPYAVVTNGDQWIVFRGLASAQKGWIDYKATIFYSAEMLQQNFSDFWNLLAKDRVKNGSLSQKLGYDVSKIPSFAKRPNSETDSPIIIGKTSQKDVDILFDYYFDDIVSRDSGKMMTECYVEENEVKEYNRELQLLLKDRLLSLGEDVETEELTETDLMSAIEAPLPDQRAKVVLLVGHVGAGKTTFLRRFFGKLEQNRGYLIGCAQTGLNLLPDERIEELLGSKVDQTNLNIDKEIESYSEIIEEKYGEKPEAILARIPKINRAVAEIQLANEVLLKQDVKVKQLETQNTEIRKRAEQAEKKLVEVDKYRQLLESKKNSSKRNKRKQKSKKTKRSKK